MQLLLLDYAVALLFPSVTELVVVVDGLKNRRIRKRPLQPTFADSKRLLVFYVSKNLKQLFAAFWTVIWTVDHLFGVFG